MDTSDERLSSDNADNQESELRGLTTEDSSDVEGSRRSDKTNKILAEAERRDEQASDRDAASDERARVADRKAFTTTDGKYTGHGERRAAALDRAESKSDRESSASDRARLTEDLPDDEGGSN